VLSAVAAGRFLTSLLFETSPTEPLAMLLAVAISILTVVLACALPARRAARLDPKEALYLE
jgi:ABC-type antimicrobial peptide transport system permease subunit